MGEPSHLHALLVVLAVGCGGTVESTPPTRDAAPVADVETPAYAGARITLEPFDPTTNVGLDVHPRLSIMGLEAPLPEATRSEFEAALSIQTWPERAPVAAKVVTTNVTSPYPQLVFEVIPTEMLADRWYVVNVRHLPRGFTYHPYSAIAVEPDGSAHNRFRPGSAPTLWGIQVCRASGSVIVHFSEKLRAKGSMMGLLEVRQAGVAAECAFPPASSSSEPQTRVHAICPALDASVVTSVRLNPGLESTLGVPMAPFIAEFVIGKLRPWGAGCVIHGR